MFFFFFFFFFCPKLIVEPKSTNAFSEIDGDHAHEKENASIKGEGGAVGLKIRKSFTTPDDDMRLLES